MTTVQRPTYAISLRQPYAELILRRIKKEERRKRPTNIRGPVYLYASKRPGDWPEDWEKVAAYPGMLPTGVIVGTAEIVDCRWDERRGYIYDLRNPIRFEHSLRPKNQPGTGFWCPEF